MFELKTMLPNVFMLEKGEKIDPDKFTEPGNYFFIHIDNVWQLIVTSITKCLVPCDNSKKLLNEFLGESPHEENAAEMFDTVDLKIPAEEFAWTMQYFRDIFAKYRTEACVVLMLNTETKHFRVLPVVQYGMSHSSVQYIHPGNSEVDMEAAKPLHALVKARYDEWHKEGYRFYGTIHSHSDFSAFYSGTDNNDDDKNDGIHITIGNVNKDWSFTARHTIRGFHWNLKYIDDVLDTPVEEIKQLVESGAVVIKPDYMKLALVSQQSHSFHHQNSFRHKDHRQKATNLLKNKDLDLEAYVDHPQYSNDILADDEVIKVYDTRDERYYFVRRTFFMQHEEQFCQSSHLFLVENHEEFESVADIEENAHDRIEKLWDEPG